MWVSISKLQLSRNDHAMHRDLQIVTGTANPDLAKAICDHLGCRLAPAVTETFSDGEIRIEIGANVRGDDVFVVQPTCAPVNEKPDAALSDTGRAQTRQCWPL